MKDCPQRKQSKPNESSAGKRKAESSSEDELQELCNRIAELEKQKKVRRVNVTSSGSKRDREDDSDDEEVECDGDEGSEYETYEHEDDDDDPRGQNRSVNVARSLDHKKQRASGRNVYKSEGNRRKKPKSGSGRGGRN